MQFKDLKKGQTIGFRPLSSESEKIKPEKIKPEKIKPEKIENAVAPAHYRQGKIEPWDFITSQKMGYLEGNIIKYVTRYKNKNGVEDLVKARTYLDKLINTEYPNL